MLRQPAAALPIDVRALFDKPVHPERVGQDHHIRRCARRNLARDGARTSEGQGHVAGIGLGDLFQSAAQAGCGKDRHALLGHRGQGQAAQKPDAKMRQSVSLAALSAMHLSRTSAMVWLICLRLAGLRAMVPPKALFTSGPWSSSYPFPCTVPEKAMCAHSLLPCATACGGARCRYC